MPNTPTRPTTDRPDVEGINSFIRDTLHHASSFASQYEGDDSVFHKQSIEAYDKFPALIAYIKALEARQVKLEEVVVGVRSYMAGGRTEKSMRAELAALDGGGE